MDAITAGQLKIVKGMGLLVVVAVVAVAVVVFERDERGRDHRRPAQDRQRYGSISSCCSSNGSKSSLILVLHTLSRTGQDRQRYKSLHCHNRTIYILN